MSAEGNGHAVVASLSDASIGGGLIWTTTDGGRVWSAAQVVPLSSGPDWYFGEWETSRRSSLLLSDDRILVADASGVHARDLSGGTWTHTSGLPLILSSGTAPGVVWAHPLSPSATTTAYRSDDGGVTFGPPLMFSFGVQAAMNGEFIGVRGSAWYRTSDPAIAASIGVTASPDPSLRSALVADDGTAFVVSAAPPYTLYRIPPGRSAPSSSRPLATSGTSAWPWPPSQVAHGADAILLNNGQFIAAP
ncbi:MAG: hypothetical protein AB7S26_19100 [Sandaracinaceae bacterium]